jgi:hypothetical protein
MKGRFLLSAALGLLSLTQYVDARPQQRNVILFVVDGMRAGSVTAEAAPALARLRDQGVSFVNPHSLFPTFTTANASAFATGHYLGDTGDFSNTILTPRPIAAAAGSVTPSIEDDAVLRELDRQTGGNFLNEATVLKLARAKGYSTAAIGKLGPTLIFDHTEVTGEQTLIFDDSTGTPAGVPLSQEVQDKLKASALAVKTPGRGDNGKAGDATTPGTTIANVEQQKYFIGVTTKVVLPTFKARNKPFLLVYWSRDPDGTQHNHGDSHLKLTPGINGPTSKAAIRNVDDNLDELRRSLDQLGLADTTDLLVAADHGFSTVSKESKTSPSTKQKFADTPEGLLPMGFVAFDLAKALGMPLYDPDNGNKRVADNEHSRRGNGLIGEDPSKPAVIVAANGGSDLIYIPGKDRRLAKRVVTALLSQDYTSGLFVDDALGRIRGTLPMSDVNLVGAAVTPRPSIVVNFRSESTCADWILCTVEVTDARQQQGQGMHGNFNRGDTKNFMAAFGPSFKKKFKDPAPASNADFGVTIAHLLGFDVTHKGSLVGRVLHEAMPGGRARAFQAHTVKSRPAANGLRTVMKYQTVGRTRYFDTAGTPGRMVGLDK